MPLLLPQDRWAAWLDLATPTAQLQVLTAPNDLHQVLHAYPALGSTTGLRGVAKKGVCQVSDRDAASPSSSAS